MAATALNLRKRSSASSPATRTSIARWPGMWPTVAGMWRRTQRSSSGSFIVREQIQRGLAVLDERITRPCFETAIAQERDQRGDEERLERSQPADTSHGLLGHRDVVVLEEWNEQLASARVVDPSDGDRHVASDRRGPGSGVGRETAEHRFGRLRVPGIARRREDHGGARRHPRRGMVHEAARQVRGALATDTRQCHDGLRADLGRRVVHEPVDVRVPP